MSEAEGRGTTGSSLPLQDHSLRSGSRSPDSGSPLNVHRHPFSLQYLTHVLQLVPCTPLVGSDLLHSSSRQSGSTSGKESTVSLGGRKNTLLLPTVLTGPCSTENQTGITVSKVHAPRPLKYDPGPPMATSDRFCAFSLCMQHSGKIRKIPNCVPHLTGSGFFFACFFSCPEPLVLTELGQLLYMMDCG